MKVFLYLFVCIFFHDLNTIQRYAIKKLNASFLGCYCLLFLGEIYTLKR